MPTPLDNLRTLATDIEHVVQESDRVRAQSVQYQRTAQLEHEERVRIEREAAEKIRTAGQRRFAVGQKIWVGVDGSERIQPKEWFVARVLEWYNSSLLVTRPKKSNVLIPAEKYHNNAYVWVVDRYALQNYPLCIYAQDEIMGPYKRQFDVRYKGELNGVKWYDFTKIQPQQDLYGKIGWCTRESHDAARRLAVRILRYHGLPVSKRDINIIT